MDQQHAQVNITSLADASEPALGSAGPFPRCEPEVAGESSSGAEALDIAHERDERRGGDDSDAGNGEQTLGQSRLRSQLFELDLDSLHAFFELADLVSHFGKRRSEEVRDRRFGVFEEGPNAGYDVVGADGDGQAKLAQDATQ